MSCSFHSFFFSSRRRHTRWPRDWSSDVCSSDLVTLFFPTDVFRSCCAHTSGRTEPVAIACVQKVHPWFLRIVGLKPSQDIGRLNALFVAPRSRVFAFENAAQRLCLWEHFRLLYWRGSLF